jgi:hypothetical protein
MALSSPLTSPPDDPLLTSGHMTVTASRGEVNGLTLDRLAKLQPADWFAFAWLLAKSRKRAPFLCFLETLKMEAVCLFAVLLDSASMQRFHPPTFH